MIRLYNLNDETNSDFEIYPRIANNFANIDIRLKEHHNLKSKAGHVEHYIVIFSHFLVRLFSKKINVSF